MTARQKADLVARAYREARETHSIELSQKLAATVLCQRCQEMSRAAAEVFVEAWYRGDV